MSRNTLRPCLKHSTDLDPPAPINTPLPFALCSSTLGPRVHFPPTHGLCQTHLTHSPAIYDRAPIVVVPNACALPKRNERTYTPTSEPPSSPKKRRPRHAALHPQAFASSANANVTSSSEVPSLVHDSSGSSSSSSESDESDVSSTPPNSTHFPSTGHPPISILNGVTVGDATGALSFLPHANEHDKPRRERSHSRSRGGSRSARKSEFAQLELDGCLGGF